LAVPAQAPEPRLSATATEVLLDLVVRDKKARIVRDLRPEEVQVFDDGVPQKLRHFEFFEGSSTLPAPLAPAPPAPTAPAPQAASPAPARDLHELRDISVVSVVVSSLDPQGRKLTLDAMHDFIKDELRPNTYVGVFWLRPSVIRAVQPYTSDAERIFAAMNAAVTFVGLGPGAPGQPFDKGPGPDKMYVGTGALAEADTPNQSSTTTAQVPKLGLTGPEAEIAGLMSAMWVTESHHVYQGSMGCLMPLRTLVQSQAAIPGRKVVLLFMAGLLVHPDMVEVLRGSISAANRSHVTIYAIDTRGFQRSDLDNSRRKLAAAAQASLAQQMKGLGGDQSVSLVEVLSPELAQASVHANTRGNVAQLAEGTGGALLSPSDLRTPLRRAMEDVRTHYKLSYSPTNAETDGRFRSIAVKVRRPGCTAFARSGYYALPLVSGRQVYSFEMATLKAINTRPLLSQFEFHAAAIQFRPGPERTQFSFAFEVPSRDLSDGSSLSL
jgi:VWFA-related protein